MTNITNAEAIERLRANYPDACYEQLREAVDAAIEALKAQDAAGDTITGMFFNKNLCDSCITKGCMFQSGIARGHCDFYNAK